MEEKIATVHRAVREVFWWTYREVMMGEWIEVYGTRPVGRGRRLEAKWNRLKEEGQGFVVHYFR